MASPSRPHPPLGGGAASEAASEALEPTDVAWWLELAKLEGEPPLDMRVAAVSLSGPAIRQTHCTVWRLLLHPHPDADGRAGVDAGITPVMPVMPVAVKQIELKRSRCGTACQRAAALL